MPYLQKIRKTKNPHRHTKGKKGEQKAAEYIQSKGYKVIELNWHKRWAEIDIVAIEQDTLVFVEVKTRYSYQRGTPEESITPRKITALKRSAQLYKAQHPEYPDALRIDFVGIDYVKGKEPRINLIKNISI